jgi:hypothetical protein
MVKLYISLASNQSKSRHDFGWGYLFCYVLMDWFAI